VKPAGHLSGRRPALRIPLYFPACCKCTKKGQPVLIRSWALVRLGTEFLRRTGTSDSSVLSGVLQMHEERSAMS
jgi:hypothetical protein